MQKVENIYYIDADISENIYKALNEKAIIKDITEEVKNQYYLYEYSDKIQVITNNPQYPSMFNYIKTGLLTEAEMREALFHK